MLSEIFGFGVDDISRLIQLVTEQFSFFEGVRWSDLYSWIGFPSDISRVVSLLISLFLLFTTVGFIRKIIVFFG